MGSRGRSIRLRIYFLVAIPLVAMVGLLGYVAGTSIEGAINLDRAPNLINATSLPAAQFGNYVQSERAAAVVYLFQPTPANLAAYAAAISATDRDEPAFKAAMTSPATVGSETAGEAKAIGTVVGNLGQLGTLRAGVKARVLSPLAALSLYSQAMTAEDQLFLTEANSETNATAVSQALGLIAAVQSREALSQEDALMSGMLAGRRMTAPDRAAFTQMAAARQDYMQSAESILSPANLAAYQARLTGASVSRQQLGTVEQATAAGVPVTSLGVTLPQWRGLAGALLGNEYRAGVATADAELVADHQLSRSAWIKVAVTCGVVLLVLLLTILVTTLVARGIIRRLRGLERSARTLAENQLPDVITRLRRGEEVDVAAEAPPLRAGAATGKDEIGRVGQAFDLVRQTAIRAAVDEATLRRGLNDVFRSLARRSQSLLHRQLALLDQMERRASDPEALDDLFRLDHLTTRMRRHAEGLVILAGAPPGRGWSGPVRMVDVMRGAVAEVEDYARVSVATRSRAALSGSAVADVIHLLAELIENGATLSPPDTSVRVSGDTVGSGFVIEVEDRGLGMNPQRLAELNERLANPPEFNPADSEQLGLFVVGQLAKRHGIQVTLKTSAYGGTAAVVLIPRHLVVTEEALRAGLPGRPAGIAAAPPVNGKHAGAAGQAVPVAWTRPAGGPEPGAAPGPGQVPGIRISGPMRSRDSSPAGLSRGAHAAPPRSAVNGPAGAGSAGFDVFAPRRRGPESGGPAGPVTPMVPVASSRGASAPGPLRAAAGDPDAYGDLKGLPRRVRQASLAPELRADPPRRQAAPTPLAGPPAGGGPGPVRGPSAGAGPTPAEIRQNMSALQRGWQEGRSQGADAAPDRAPAPPADAGDPEAPGGERAAGESDGG
jgi:signal transduction histidine kinase